MQKDVMNLITAQRTTQQALASIEIHVGKLSDHVEEVDDHLRGVAGRESLDARVAIIEHEQTQHGRLLSRIVDQLDDIQADVSKLTIRRAVSKEVDTEKTEWYKSFWLPIILALLAGAGWLGQYGITHKEEVAAFFKWEPKSAARLRAESEKEKRGPRGKAVREKERKLLEEQRRRAE
ncbi:MAG: hypothetical protein DMF62_02415 [Acidobacteria bacterium]|nr:MAG: hypothetical protein DMF62_02415 [Acidobacteriota bacterium]